jgi:hypothetical protein
LLMTAYFCCFSYFKTPWWQLFTELYWFDWEFIWLLKLFMLLERCLVTKGFLYFTPAIPWYYLVRNVPCNFFLWSHQLWNVLAWLAFEVMKEESLVFAWSLEFQQKQMAAIDLWKH